MSRHRLFGNGPVRIEDEARFLRSWVERPLVTGAVTPSGKMLARTMASYLDPDAEGQVVELGPGTGPVTEAILRRGVPEERLVLVEYNEDFCRLLARRFPRATILQGDAYNFPAVVAGALQGPAAATVSSLPLFTRPLPVRQKLLRDAFAAMRPGAPFVQFTYSPVSPLPKSAEYTSEPSNRVWWNLPPARVWAYRLRQGAEPASPRRRAGLFGKGDRRAS
ncbi:class I SAM-dependent methyltransferase [Camelimonas abortus]|uniref:Class I SAM-dependent methyltransferase n=1 Tax=Camelimonas abortus TaxID=1017184 RepID=A0ABV7LBF2_9HYPH